MDNKMEINKKVNENSVDKCEKIEIKKAEVEELSYTEAYGFEDGCSDLTDQECYR